MERAPVEYNHPKDSGWAWVILFASGVANFVVNGGVRTMGLLFVELVEMFHSTPTVTIIVTGFIAAGFAIFSCVGNIVGVRFTMRKVAVAGAALSFIGMFLTTFAPNMLGVIITLGFISGMGYGFLFGPSMVLIGQYWPKRLSFANGLAVSGGSIGQLVLPFFITGVIARYQFRGGILVYSALLLHGIPAMLLLRPPSFYGVKKRGRAQRTDDEGPTSPLTGDSEDIRRPSAAGIAAAANLLSPDDPDKFVRKASVPLPASRTDVAEELNVPEGDVTVKMTGKLLLKKCCDPALICNSVFIIYVLALSIGHSGFIGACTFFAPYVEQLFFGSKTMVAMTVLAMGAGDLIGRVGGGIIAQRGWFSKTSLVGFSFIISGILAIAMTFFGRSLVVIFGFSVLFGLLGGTYMSQLVAMVDDLFGSALLASSLGLSTMIMGLFAIPILLFLGAVSSQKPPLPNRPRASVQVAAILTIIAGILFYLIPVIAWCRSGGYKRWRQNRVKQPPPPADDPILKAELGAGVKAGQQGVGGGGALKGNSANGVKEVTSTRPSGSGNTGSGGSTGPSNGSGAIYRPTGNSGNSGNSGVGNPPSYMRSALPTGLGSVGPRGEGVDEVDNKMGGGVGEEEPRRWSQQNIRWSKIPESDC